MITIDIFKRMEKNLVKKVRYIANYTVVFDLMGAKY